VFKAVNNIFYIGITLFTFSCSWKKTTVKLPPQLIEQLNNNPESAIRCPDDYLLNCLYYSLDKIIETRTLFEVYRFKDNLSPKFIRNHWSDIKSYFNKHPKAPSKRSDIKIWRRLRSIQWKS